MRGCICQSRYFMYFLHSCCRPSKLNVFEFWCVSQWPEKSSRILSDLNSIINYRNTMLEREYFVVLPIYPVFLYMKYGIKINTQSVLNVNNFPWGWRNLVLICASPWWWVEIGKSCWHERQRESSIENISVLHIFLKKKEESSRR